MTLVLLQAENPESFGLNLPGSPSHAAEAVYAMPKPRICIATVQCYNPSSVPGEAPAVRVKRWAAALLTEACIDGLFSTFNPAEA